MKERIKSLTLADFEHNETAYGEPQSFIELESGRSIEITLEMEGLKENDYYYSVRLNCSDEEFDNDDFHSTCGVIEAYATEGNNLDEAVELVMEMLSAFNETIAE